MDEADCFSFQRGFEGEKCSLPVSLPVHGKDESYMYERVKNQKENLTHCNNNHPESSHPVSGKIDVKPFENDLSSSLPLLTSTTVSKAHENWSSPIKKAEGYCKSSSIRGDRSFQHQVDYEKSRIETRCGDLSSTKKDFDPEDQTQFSDTAISSSDCMRVQQDNLPSSIGTDETDQGQVVPNFSLTEQHSEYHTALPKNSQYYPKPRDSAGLNLTSDSTLKQSPGLSCHPTAISHTHMGHHEESLRAIHHQCSASSTMQAQLESNSKPFGSSSITPVEVEEGEFGKRKTSCDEKVEDEGHWSRMKRQKMSTTIQQEVQYNQTVMSPTQYQVSGKGNYIFEAPNNCTFNLYKSGQDKQHALQWASRQSSQTDSVTTGSIPTESLQTIAKLIAQTTEWKKIARLLPMTECPTLESDIKSLEECHGTTSDKTFAVLMRWWREHPEQGDRTKMKECLQRGLESCKLVRLARAIDKYFPDA